MSDKTNSDESYTAVLELYDKLVQSFQDIERKGKTMPYTSVNGHMFSFLDKEGNLSMRLPDEIKNKFIKKYDSELSVQHGRVMKEYVLVPKKLLSDSASLKRYFKESYEYTRALKPKPTKK